MELRGCSHLHFVQVLRRGSVFKILNLDSSKRPALRFKKLKDVYESDNARNTGSHLNKGHYGEVKIESSYLPIDRKLAIKSDPETSELSFYCDDNNRNSDWDDCIFGEMTLKQLRVLCKSKKRKLTNSVEFRTQDVEIPSTLKQDPAMLEAKDHDFDLEEPLSSLKLKMSRNSKARRKFVRKNMFSSSEALVLALNTEENLNSVQDAQQSDRDPFGAINGTVELEKPSNLVCQAAVCTSDVSSSACQEKDEFYGGVCEEVGETVTGKELGTGDTISVANESPRCVVNEVSYEYVEHAETASYLPVHTVVGTTKDMDLPEMTDCGSSVNPVCRSEEGNNGPLTRDSPLGTTSPIKDLSLINGSCGDSFAMQDELLCQFDSQSENQVLDIAIEESFQCMAHTSSGNVHLLDKEIKEDLLPDLKANFKSNSSSHCFSSQGYNLCMNPSKIVDSVDESLPMTKHSCLKTEISTCAGAGASASETRNRSAWSHSSDAIDRYITTEVLGNHPYNQGHPPKRLFLKRKAISPNSQKKLRKAVDCNEPCGSTEHYGLEEADAGSPEWIIKKQKNGSLHSDPKSILKGTHVSCAITHSTTECTTIYSCSQKAIAFSQRQMHDIEGLAMKLGNELKALKGIVEEVLHFQGCQSTSSKYTEDEMRIAIEKAAEVEEITRRWLSMMARDCNRFCKIMRLTKKGAAEAGIRVQEGRKKITFADEAGGMLCHVKVFENCSAAPMGSESEKLDPEDKRLAEPPASSRSNF